MLEDDHHCISGPTVDLALCSEITKEKLAPILEHNLRQLESLKVLEVHGPRKGDMKGLEFAEETIKWFADRNSARSAAEAASAQAAAMASNVVNVD